jgi:hypothetical protein
LLRFLVYAGALADCDILSCLLLFFSLGSISNLAFNSWMQDFVRSGFAAIILESDQLLRRLPRPREFTGCRRRGFFQHTFSEVGIYSVFF